MLSEESARPMVSDQARPLEGRPPPSPDLPFGDTDTFETFYRNHIHAVERFIARRISDPHEVADLTAEVFVAVITSAARYDPDRGTPSAWLFGIAHRVVAGHYRGVGRRAELEGRVSGRAVLDSAGEAAVERLTERIDAERRAKPVLDAVRQLPQASRDVVLLVDLDGLAVAEAAQVLGISATAARVRLHRARRAITAQLTRNSSFTNGETTP